MAVEPNPYVQALEAYEVTPQEPWQVHEELELHKLDWNEGAFIPSFARRFARDLLLRNEYFNWYPDCAAINLTEHLAESLNVSLFNVLTFPGSDVALDTLCRAYLVPGDVVLIPTPTYENFFSFAAASAGSLQFVQIAKPYTFDSAHIIERHGCANPKLVYLVSPNNPCGYLIDKADIGRICSAFPDALIIVDQAYIDFAQQPCCADLVLMHDNLAITRTFSKAFGLAGLRLGYIVAGHDILSNVAKIRNGKNVGMLAQELGVQLLRRRSEIEAWVSGVVESRRWLVQEMSQLGVTSYPSHANFVLFEVPEPKYFMAEFKRHGVYVRDKSKAASNCLRVTVTTKRSAAYFLEVLQKLSR